ncbi:MAG: Hpt domain-containing protein [Oscillospiraceae bacterium]|nr:Hpt domain-containing protein [Oscillospiraceae bacterium]
MLTIAALNELGADTQSGLSRCLNNEAFYLRMVNLAVQDDGFERLRAALERGDLDEGFERAYALKGVLGNVSLTNLFTPVSEITEALRARTQMDYAPLLEQIFSELEKLRALVD